MLITCGSVITQSRVLTLSRASMDHDISSSHNHDLYQYIDQVPVLYISGTTKIVKLCIYVSHM